MASVETIALGASARTESASAQDQYVIGPYLNQGGMATVFLGKHIGRTGISTPIVLKRLRSELTHVPELRALLFSEAELQSRLLHPCIVRTTDLVVIDGEYYLVMEYVRGGDLLLLLRYLPMPVPPQDGSFARPPRPVETGLFASIQRYAGGSGQAVAWGYIYPATMLREEVLARLQPLLLDVAVDPSITTLTAAQVRTAITAKVSPIAGTLAGTLWQEFAVLTGLTRSRAASAHGGTVRVEERPGGGSVFVLSLPR